MLLSATILRFHIDIIHLNNVSVTLCMVFYKHRVLFICRETTPDGISEAVPYNVKYAYKWFTQSCVSWQCLNGITWTRIKALQYTVFHKIKLFYARSCHAKAWTIYLHIIMYEHPYVNLRVFMYKIATDITSIVFKTIHLFPRRDYVQRLCAEINSSHTVNLKAVQKHPR